MVTYVSGSKQPAKNNYGQNGYTGPSSTCPGEPVPTADLVVSKGNYVDGDKWQTRDVGAPKTAIKR